MLLLAATGYLEAINQHLELALAIAAGETFLPCISTIVCFVWRLFKVLEDSCVTHVSCLVVAVFVIGVAKGLA